MSTIHTARLVFPPLKPRNLTLVTTMMSRHYGSLESDKTNQAFMREFVELRDEIIPTWSRGESRNLGIRHVMTLLCVLAAFETIGLNRYKGDRTMQRKACMSDNPEFLTTITNLRTALKRCEYKILHTKDHPEIKRVMPL